MIVQKYPMSFQDNTLGDLKMNDGAQSLFMQIEYRLGCCRRPMKFKFLSKLAHLFFQTAFSPVEHEYEVSKNFINVYPTCQNTFRTHFLKKINFFVTGGRHVKYT